MFDGILNAKKVGSVHPGYEAQRPALLTKGSSINKKALLSRRFMSLPNYAPTLTAQVPQGSAFPTVSMCFHKILSRSSVLTSNYFDCQLIVPQ